MIVEANLSLVAAKFPGTKLISQSENSEDNQWSNNIRFEEGYGNKNND